MIFRIYNCTGTEKINFSANSVRLCVIISNVLYERSEHHFMEERDVKLTDTEIMQLFRSSPDRAYEAIIDRYGNLVYAIVLNKLKNNSSREDTEDCVSDIFAEVFKNMDRYESSCGTLKGFVSTIAKRRAIDEYRKMLKLSGRTVSMDDDIAETLFTGDTPELENEKISEKQLIWKAVRDLGEPDSVILVQQFFYDKTADEIGKLLSMTASAVQKRSVRAREKLRKILTEKGITY